MFTAAIVQKLANSLVGVRHLTYLITNETRKKVDISYVGYPMKPTGLCLCGCTQCVNAALYNVSNWQQYVLSSQTAMNQQTTCAALLTLATRWMTEGPAGLNDTGRLLQH